MESKQEIDAIMQEANFEDPEQTREFLDEHEFENQQEIQEYLMEHTQDGALEYLVRGALLACRLGTIPNKLNLPRCHGVYITTHPVVHWRNSEPLKNIPPFGICSVTQEPCKPDIVGFWRDTYSETRIVDNGDINFGDRQTAKNLDSNPDGPKPKGEDSITTISFLICAKGGLIEPLKSGQEQTNDPEEQEYANDHVDPEECRQCADDKKPMHEKNKVQENKGDVHGSEFDKRKEITSQIKQDLSWLEEIKNVGYYSTEDALDIIQNKEPLIESLSEKYGIPKAAIQTILLRELRFMDVRDDFADSLVIGSNEYVRQLEEWNNLPTSKKFLVPPPSAPLINRWDSSTGYAQIFSWVAIDAINHAIQKGITTKENLGLDPSITLDKKNQQDIYFIWKRLHDDPDFNLEVATLNLVKCADDEVGKPDYENYSEDEIKTMLSRYNGTNDDAKQYGQECYNCYEIFKKYE